MRAWLTCMFATLLLWAFSVGPAAALGDASTITGSDVIVVLFLCGLMGLVGQGARMIVGLKTMSDYKPVTTASDQDKDVALFSLARLLTSLVIGFVAGVLAGMAYWKAQGGIDKIDTTSFDTMIKFAIAGYVGTDIVEAFTSKYFEPSAASALKDVSLAADDTTSKPAALPPVGQPVDLGPLTSKIDDLSDKVDGISRQAGSTTDAFDPTTQPAGSVTLASLVTHSPAPPLLGALSSKYEVGGRGPGTVSSGVGDPGGASYGSYQMTSKTNGGTVKLFVSQLPADKKQLFANLTPGDAAFTAVWKHLAAADPGGFFMLQHQFIQTTHYMPVCQSVAAKVAIADRSFALQNVVWSTAVQHGAKTGIVALVAQRFDFANETGPIDALDALMIKGIYAERGRRLPDGRLAHFSSSAPDIQAGVTQRFIAEQRDALKMHASESGGTATAARADEYDV